MKKETPIQKLKGHIHDRLIAAEELDEPTRFLEGLMLIADQFLEEEREVIDDAYLCGLNRGLVFQGTQSLLCEGPSVRDYYQENFNTTDDESNN